MTVVKEVTEVHVFDHGSGVTVWNLFFAPPGTYKEGRFEATADGSELLRFCFPFLTREGAESAVRSTVDLSHELGEPVTVFHHRV